MKNLYILLLLAPFLCLAQETRTIKTVGRAIHSDTNPVYTASMVVSQSFLSYPAEAISLEQLKNTYDEALKKNGLALSQLKEDSFGYYFQGYVKEGTLYRYETTSIESFHKFLASNSYGAQRSDYVYTMTITADESVLLAKKAIENARMQAHGIAEKLEKHLGEIISIEDHNIPDIPIERSLYNNTKIGHYEYDVTVVFALNK